MSNLIPSLETFAKVGRPSDSIFPPSVPRAVHLLYTAVPGVFFFSQAVFCLDRVLMAGLFVVCLRGRLRRPRDWAR